MADGSATRPHVGGAGQCLRVDIFPDFRHFTVSDGDGEDPFGLVANISAGRSSPLTAVIFIFLLTFWMPKRRARRLFWLLTIQPPAKPKPFRSQSIASKPAMVRRAVLNDWKPPTFGMFFFTRKWLLSIPCWRCLVT
jgi:hypothetical protein